MVIYVFKIFAVANCSAPMPLAINCRVFLVQLTKNR